MFDIFILYELLILIVIIAINGRDAYSCSDNISQNNMTRNGLLLLPARLALIE